MGLSSSKDEFKSISVTDYDSETFSLVNNNNTNNQLNSGYPCELLVKSSHEIVDNQNNQLITGSKTFLLPSTVNSTKLYQDDNVDINSIKINKLSIGQKKLNENSLLKSESNYTNNNSDKLFLKDSNKEMNDFLHLFNSNQSNNNNLRASPVTIKSKFNFYNSNQHNQIRYPIMDHLDIVGELNCHKVPSARSERPKDSARSSVCLERDDDDNDSGGGGGGGEDDDDVTVDVKSVDDNKRETDQVISEIDKLLSEPDDLLTPSPYTWRRGRSLGNIIEEKRMSNQTHSSSSDRSMDSLLKNYPDNQINVNCDDLIDYQEKAIDHRHPPSLESANGDNGELDQLESIEQLICNETKSSVKNKVDSYDELERELINSIESEYIGSH